MTTYSYEQVLGDSLDYFRDDLPARVFADKYAMKDLNGEYIESKPEHLWRRIAKEFARIEAKKFAEPLTEEQIYNYIKDYARIIPQGSPMYGIGNPRWVSVSNCFVLESPEDSYGGIHYVDEQITQISKRRGGVGINLNKLRPVGSPTRNSSNSSTGIRGWMERYSNSIREVGQAGRRGALMLTLNVHHPDISDFITAKKDRTKVTGANISVQYTDEFLKAVENDEEYEQRFPLEGEPTVTRRVRAREIWELAVENAWENAEPGLLFWDNVLNQSVANCYKDHGFEDIGTNPCAELVLCALDSCRLLLLNTHYYVRNPYSSKAEFDFDLFYQDAQIAQRLMDDLVDLEIECVDRIIKKVKKDPEPTEIKVRELNLWQKIREKCVMGRRTGTGVTAIGDTIASLGLKYGSNKSIEIVEEIYRTLKLGAYRSSVDMAKELGAFPLWDWKLERENVFLNRIKEEDARLWKDMKRYGRRNIALLTTAPTGSVSTQASLSFNIHFVNNDNPCPSYLQDFIFMKLHGTTGGIEPLFMEQFTRRKKGNPGDADFRSDFVDDLGDHWMHFPVDHPGLALWKLVNPKKNVEKNPYRGACAQNIDWRQRVRLQAAAQKHVDHSISSTLNLPENVTKERVNEIYMTAWKSGCKGVTVYRDNCRTGVLVDKIEEFPAERPREVDCDVLHVSVNGNPYCVLIGTIHDRPYEVWAFKNGYLNKKVKHGKIIKYLRPKMYKAVLSDGFEICPIGAGNSHYEDAITRLSSACLQSGMDVIQIVRQLEKVGGDITNFVKAICRCLKRYVKDNTKEKGVCESCGEESLVRMEGCISCKTCGWSKC